MELEVPCPFLKSLQTRRQAQQHQNFEFFPLGQVEKLAQCAVYQEEYQLETSQNLKIIL